MAATERGAISARVAAAAIVLLGLGLIRVWSLSLQTPFRLIDDYGAFFAVWRSGLADALRDNFSLRVNPMRFRPTHDLGQLVAWGLFSDHPAWHHLMRLLMKLGAFAALMAVAVRGLESRAPRGLDRRRMLPLVALAIALFFYFPNNPEARLAPQELGTVMYFMAALYFVGWRAPGRSRALADLLCFCSFTLAIWCKEPNFIMAAPLLVHIVLEAAARRGAGPHWPPAFVLAHVAVWAHAALKASVMNVRGYGRAPLSHAALEGMVREFPRQILLSGSAWWMPLVFIAGVSLYVALGLRRRPEGILRAGLPLWILAASLVQWSLMWSPVLRYAYPTVAFLALVTITGFGLLLAHAPTDGAAARRGMALSALAVLVAAVNDRDMVRQFSVQFVAGRSEERLLAAVERLKASDHDRAVNVVNESEYEQRLVGYFNRHLPFYLGRCAHVVFVRHPDRVRAGGHLVSRHRDLAGYEEVLRLDPVAPPAAVAISEAISRYARAGTAAREVPLDAGAEEPRPWYVFRRSAE